MVQHEINQAAHVEKTFAEIIEAMGGTRARSLRRAATRPSSTGGVIIHEVGGAIMGVGPEEVRDQQLRPDAGT